MTKTRNPLAASLALGWKQLASRPIYLCMMVLVPVGFALFYLSILDSGLPQRSPVAVVDLDHTAASRQITRNLDAMQLVDVAYMPDSYAGAMNLLKSGKVYGFFMIPRGFAADAGAGRPTALSYYNNMAYFIPGMMTYRNFRVSAVTTSAGIAMKQLSATGLDERTVTALLSPVTPDVHALGNPWVSYSIYLGNSFIPCMLQLAVMLVTCFSILQEIKRRTSVRWIGAAGGSIITAVLGKLLPQFAVFSAVGMLLLAILYGFNAFPMQGSIWAMAGAMELLILSSQALALFISSVVVNLRFALSILTLTAILAFSVAGFSYPVGDMYGAVAIFSWLLPVRYYFLIYINVALNGYPAYFCRWEYVGMTLFLLLPALSLWKLRRNALEPVYLP